MGCGGSKAAAAPAAAPAAAGNTVKIYGMPPSMNCVGPIMVAMETKSGGMEMCDLMSGAHKKPEYLAINPLGQVPGLDDGFVKSGESLTILRYLAMKYGPTLYPVKNPAACVRIDFAMDDFAKVSKAHMDVVYPVFGFKDAPADQAAANTAYGKAIVKWLETHLHMGTGPFVLGDDISIADYKAVPFLFAAMQPAIQNNAGFTPPARMSKYCEDFMAKVGASAFMKSAGGYSIAEYAASKLAADKKADPTPAEEFQTSCNRNVGVPGAAGGVKVHGMPPSANCVGPIMLAMETKAGNMEMCDLMSGANKKPEYLAINPAGQVPGLSDGTVTSGESVTILRYLAMQYGPKYYPVDNPVACCKIDFAMDDFANVYAALVDVVYPVFGFKAAPENQEEANTKTTGKVDEWLQRHLTGKFVNGTEISIADFKAVPFLFALMQPAMKTNANFSASARMIQYCEDFVAAVPASAFMKTAGGYALAEYAASKAKQ